MKDYSQTEIEKKNFILHFKENEDSLFVTFAGEKEPFVVPKSYREILLKQMREQVLNSDNFKSDKLLKKRIYKFGAALFAILTIIIGISLGNITDIVNVLLLMIPFGVSAYSFAKIIQINSMLKDLEKNKRFLEMEESLNTNARKTNVLANVSSRTKRMIEKAPEYRRIFDINSFESFPFNDLEQIMVNIKRNETFGFVYSEEGNSPGTAPLTVKNIKTDTDKKDYSFRHIPSEGISLEVSMEKEVSESKPKTLSLKPNK